MDNQETTFTQQSIVIHSETGINLVTNLAPGFSAMTTISDPQLEELYLARKTWKQSKQNGKIISARGDILH